MQNMENENELFKSEYVIDDINFDDVNIEELNEFDSNGLETNNILNNSENLALELNDEQINQFYKYLSGQIQRPEFADKFFADADSRIRESNQLTAMMGLSFVPKLLAT